MSQLSVQKKASLTPWTQTRKDTPKEKQLASYTNQSQMKKPNGTECAYQPSVFNIKIKIN